MKKPSHVHEPLLSRPAATLSSPSEGEEREGRGVVEFKRSMREIASAKSLLNRRNFTKSTLLAAAALASGDFSAVAQSPKRIRTGVIGCGSVSGSYLPVLSKCPYAEVVGLCDIRPERARKRAEQFQVV